MIENAEDAAVMFWVVLLHSGVFAAPCKPKQRA
jgi:hypothetical protein